MAVKLARYIFKKIRGRIIPIRIGLDRASKSINKLVDKVNKYHDVSKGVREAKRISPKRKPNVDELMKVIKAQTKIRKKGLKKIGSGVDFDVFKRSVADDFVIKTNKLYGFNRTKGTANKEFTKRWPMLKDKYAVHKVVGDNLPDYGIATIPSEVIRLKKGRRGVLQEFLSKKRFKGADHYQRQQDRYFKRDHGLSLDVHAGNVVDNAYLADTGVALIKSRATAIDSTGLEVLGIKNNYGTKLKEVYNKSTVMSDEALLSGQSKKMLRKINAMTKKGYRYKKIGSNEYKLVKKK